MVLSGGSAFGLAACDGVVRWCEERGLGFPTAAGPVPIVVGAVIFDLMVGDASVRPDAEAGYAACVAATAGDVALGPVGAGTGATVGKWRGREFAQPGGVGSASCTNDALVVAALVVVNAFGELRGRAQVDAGAVDTAGAFENTTVGVIATNADPRQGGLPARRPVRPRRAGPRLEPVHATVDGDALVATSVGGVEAPVDQVEGRRAEQQAVGQDVG